MAAPAARPDISTCHNCGKFFPRLYVALCKECAGVEENRFRLVREFLTDNHGVSLNEVAEGTGLSRGEVARFYDQGRLVEIATGWGAEQSFCSCAIEGQRCGYCRQKLARQLDEAARTPPANPREAPPAPYVGRAAPKPGAKAGQPGGRREKQEDSEGRVRYVRRARREGDS